MVLQTSQQSESKRNMKFVAFYMPPSFLFSLVTCARTLAGKEGTSEMIASGLGET